MSQAAFTPRPVCRPQKRRPIPVPHGIAPPRLEAIRVLRSKWVNGTILHFHFLDGPGWNWPEPQKEAARDAFQTWKKLGIGLEFAETADPTEAELRIGFDQGDGSWSFVGSDVLHNEDRGRTMNYGWDLTDEWGRATALHEIGHAIGMPHEHQSPKAGISWNEDAVYEYFGSDPNFWDRSTIYENILRKLEAHEVEGGPWDAKSIMEYPFKAGLILGPSPYDQGIRENTRLSRDDIAWARRFYPPLRPAKKIGLMDLKPLGGASGDQRDFVFEPEATRDYTIRTIGQSDSKLVLFSERDGVPRYKSSVDDSGLPENAALTTQLVKGRRYTIRARTHYVAPAAAVGLVIS